MKTKTHTLLAISTLFLAACGDKEAPKNSSATINAGSGERILLKTDLPPENILGTPQPIRVPNLQPAPTSPPTLIVPEGTTCLSLGKPVSGSDDFPIIGELNYITDGDKEAGEGYFVELMDGLQWVQIDLGAPAKISAIWLWHYHQEARAYHDVVVQLSKDPDFKNGVTTLFNNDYDNSAGFGKGSHKPYVETRYGKLVDAKNTEARFVRLYSNGNTSSDTNHYIEVEVFGIEK